MKNFEYIPILDLKGQYASIKTEIDEAIQRVLDRQQFILGEEVRMLEKEIEEYCGAKDAIGVSSGTDALLVSLMALNIGYGDEVITTPFTFLSTASCISRLEAIPVFVDIDPDTYNIDTGKIEGVITDRTRAIIPVHFAGQMANMDAIMDIAKRNNLYVIEDAAQAIGSEYKFKMAGTIGDIGCFSFYPSKNLGAYGDAGMVLVNDADSIYNNPRALRNHGQTIKYESWHTGGNFRMDDIQAAILRAKLPHLDAWNDQRRVAANLYREALSGLEIVLPGEAYGTRPTYHLFVVRVKHRDRMLDYMYSHGVRCAVHYPNPMHLQPCFSHLAYRKGSFPVAEKACDEVMSLPLYPEMTLNMIDKVVETLKKGLKQ